MNDIPLVLETIDETIWDREIEQMYDMIEN